MTPAQLLTDALQKLPTIVRSTLYTVLGLAGAVLAVCSMAGVDEIGSVSMTQLLEVYAFLSAATGGIAVANVQPAREQEPRRRPRHAPRPGEEPDRDRRDGRGRRRGQVRDGKRRGDHTPQHTGRHDDESDHQLVLRRGDEHGNPPDSRDQRDLPRRAHEQLELATFEEDADLSSFEPVGLVTDVYGESRA